ALALDPKSENAFFQRGRAEIGEEKWTAAIADFNKALEIDSSDSGAHYWLALAQFNLGSYPSALTEIEAYIPDNGDDGDGHLLRAQIEFKLGNAGEARTSASTALKQYRVANDVDGAAKAQKFLDSLGSAPPPSP
ncbi:MAG TPA: tetratricopeptide repeat protein, partial [Candidatus Cybelea sp.]|nr:tetratricopeptide repeat protein [Candidatus Cybelea sp.]